MRKTLILLLILTTTIAFAKPKTSIRWPVNHYDLNVSFNLEEHTVNGTCALTIPRKGVKTAGFLLNKDFTVVSAKFGDIEVKPAVKAEFRPDEVSGNYGVFGSWTAEEAKLWTVEIPKKAKKQKPLVLEIEYQGKIYNPPGSSQFSREKIAFEIDGTIGNEGVFLSPSAYWYPMLPDFPASYIVTANLPKGWNCVTSGKPSEPMVVGDRVEITHVFDKTSDGLCFSAGAYDVKKITHKGVDLMTYFLPEQAMLADDYLEACAGFIDMYSDLIGPYPFSKFAVVDNFIPSGYGMPGWTLLGSEVIRLPFIKDISLGHEILHNYFGNSLFVDYSQGNWCEGLTVYFADYKYKADKDSLAAQEYRMNILKDYSSYVKEKNDYALNSFVERRESSDRAIGYGKSMMTFHMLAQMLDQLAPGMFAQVVRETYEKYQWQAIGWEQWQKEFERRLGQKLDWFFEEWVRQPGAPKIMMDNLHFENYGEGWELSLEVITETNNRNPYNYMLKIRGLTSIGLVETNAFIRQPRQRVDLAGRGEIRSIQLDPAFDTFRTIYPGESPITLSNFYGDEEGILVIPSDYSNEMTYRKVAEGLKNKGQKVVKSSELTDEMKARSLWIFGGSNMNPVWDEFKPDPTRMEYLPYVAPRWVEEAPVQEGFRFNRKEFRGGKLSGTLVLEHPQSRDKVIVYSVAMPTADVVESMRKLSHYGKYSYLLFDNGKNVEKGVWAISGESPMAWRASE